MNRISGLITIALLLWSSIAIYATSIVSTHSATALNQINIYPDSTFFSNDFVKYKEGSLFEIVSTSVLEHEDADQNQKFKWYQVRSIIDGQIGWAYGDGLATYSSEYEVPSRLKAFHNKTIRLNEGFEDAVMWIASIQGRDNFHKQDYMNPIYNEYYLVLTNNKGKSVHLKCSGVSAMGETSIHKLLLADVTEDKIPEFIIQRSTLANGSDIEERALEIYSMKAGTLVNIFEERMTLTFRENTKSPALFKYAQIDKNSIRISFLDYKKCTQYKLDYETDLQKYIEERCLEYVTYTYNWDKYENKYRLLYDETRIAPEAGIRDNTAVLKVKPTKDARSISTITSSDLLTVVKHSESYSVVEGKKHIHQYLLVQTPSGQMGYVPAEDIGFIDIEHADIINTFYPQAILIKNDWKRNEDFITVSPDILYSREELAKKGK